MHINYVTLTNNSLASNRYRIEVPAFELSKRHKVTITEKPNGGDVTVFSKHFNQENEQFYAKTCKENGSLVVFDMCDYHLEHPDFGNHYRRMLEIADLVTVSTHSLAELFEEYVPIVIKDPYVYPEAEAKFKPEGILKILWFGHQTNIGGLIESYPALNGYMVQVITGDEAKETLTIPFTQWSHEAVLEGLYETDIVIIPTSTTKQRTLIKGNNRMLESIRRGRFVVASAIPSHQEFSPYMYIGDIKKGIEWVQSHQDEIVPRIKEAQEYIKKNYSPEQIAKEWENTFTFHLQEVKCAN